MNVREVFFLSFRFAKLSATKNVYLFKSSCGTVEEGFMTWVIRKLKLGITKQDTEINPWNKTRIRFARPKVLIRTHDYCESLTWSSKPSKIFIRNDRATNIPFNVGWRKFVFIQNIILNECTIELIEFGFLVVGKREKKSFFFQITFIYEKKREHSPMREISRLRKCIWGPICYKAIFHYFRSNKSGYFFINFMCFLLFTERITPGSAIT